MQVLQQQFLEILATVLTILASIVGQHLITFFKSKDVLAKIEAKQKIAEVVVNAVEHIYFEENGPEKCVEAKTKIINILSENGILIGQEELNMLIESAVKGMNDSLEKGNGDVQ